jgi:required for meiotic nuclear division protein 1
MAGITHSFEAVSFAENTSLSEFKALCPDAAGDVHQVSRPLGGGRLWLYPFGAIVAQDVAPEAFEAELARLRGLRAQLGEPAQREEFAVREEQGAAPAVAPGVLTIDRLTPERASIVALTVAQSVAMEYYEGIVESMFTRTEALVSGLEKRGTVAPRVRSLHKFIGNAVATRSEVLSVLHLLDMPDEVWDDPAIDRIYAQLRAEFDLVDRYAALESKLRSVQEALELVLDVARDRRGALLEASIVALIVFEIVLSLLRGH